MESKKFLYFLFAIIFGIYSSIQSNDQIEEKWSVNLLEADITIGEISDICFNGSLLAFDNTTVKLFEIHEYNGGVELITTFSLGRGPNEFQEISSIICNESKIYLLDYQLHKLLEYQFNTKEIIEKDINTNLNWVAKLIEIDDDLYVNNYDPENYNFYTRLSDGERFIQPFKEGEVPRHALRAMEQLTQSALLSHDNYFYHFLHAPYRITKYDQEFNKILTIEDERSVNPWNGYIFINEARYRVDRYPRLGDDCFQIEHKAVCEYYLYEKGESYIDLWSLPDMKKIKSMKNNLNQGEVEYYLSYSFQNKNSDSIMLLFINHDSFKMKLLSLNI